MIYAVAIIAVALLGIIFFGGHYADKLFAWIQYVDDKKNLQAANRAGDLNAIRHYAERVRDYQTRTKS